MVDLLRFQLWHIDFLCSIKPNQCVNTTRLSFCHSVNKMILVNGNAEKTNLSKQNCLLDLKYVNYHDCKYSISFNKPIIWSNQSNIGVGVEFKQ